MKTNTKKILSIIFSLTLLISLNLNTLVYANEITENNPEITAEETNATEETTTKETEITESTKENTKKEVLKETTKPIEESKIINKEDTKTTNTTNTSSVLFEIIAKDSKGKETVHSNFDVEQPVGSYIRLPIKDMYENIIDVKGGNAKLVDNDLLVEVQPELVVTITIQLENFEQGQQETRVVFVDTDGNPVVNVPYNNYIKLYDKPGTVSTYKPPISFYGYKLVGTEDIIIPENNGTNPVYVKVVYEKVPISLTVTYTDQGGNTVKQADKFVKHIGETVDINLPIDGYTALGLSESSYELPKGATTIPFTFGGDAFSQFDLREEAMDILYEKNSVNTTTVKQLDNNINNNKVSVEKTDIQTARTLPQTGTAKVYTTIAGIAIVAVGIIIFFKNKNK